MRYHLRNTAWKLNQEQDVAVTKARRTEPRRFSDFGVEGSGLAVCPAVLPSCLVHYFLTMPPASIPTFWNGKIYYVPLRIRHVICFNFFFFFISEGVRIKRLLCVSERLWTLDFWAVLKLKDYWNFRSWTKCLLPYDMVKGLWRSGGGMWCFNEHGFEVSKYWSYFQCPLCPLLTDQDVSPQLFLSPYLCSTLWTLNLWDYEAIKCFFTLKKCWK
jgi:hypothetical protein